MAVCEHCWTEASFDARLKGGTVVDHYNRLLENQRPRLPPPQRRNRARGIRVTRTKRQKRIAAARKWQEIYDLGYMDGHHAGGDYAYPHTDAVNPHLEDGEEIIDGHVYPVNDSETLPW